jgi:hypothetical protein
MEINEGFAFIPALIAGLVAVGSAVAGSLAGKKKSGDGPPTQIPEPIFKLQAPTAEAPIRMTQPAGTPIALPDDDQVPGQAFGQGVAGFFGSGMDDDLRRNARGGF